MTFATFCSGIGAPEMAWKPLGWRSLFASEIEPFACAVLAHHHPQTPNLGDMERISREQVQEFGPADVVCAGTPCQSFSIAGLRGGMADPRGNLALVFLRLVDWLRPRWVVWENVPGVLSSGAGRDFGSFLGALGQLGYGWSYRVLDAQYFGVPQRRRRVFVVGCLGDWRGAAAVLLERSSLSGHPAPSREAGARVAASLTRGADGSGGGGYAGRRREDDQNIVLTSSRTATGRLDPNGETFVVAGCLNANGKAAGSATQQDAECGMLVAHSLRADGFDASEDGTGRRTPLVPCIAHGENSHAMREGGSVPAAFETDRARCLDSTGGYSHNQGGTVIAIQERAVSEGTSGPDGKGWQEDVAFTLESRHRPQNVSAPMGVRRLVPRECERLQGFPDDYSLIPYRGKLAADGPRYRAIGNSMARPVLRWLGKRIDKVHALMEAAHA